MEKAGFWEDKIMYKSNVLRTSVGFYFHVSIRLIIYSENV